MSEHINNFFHFLADGNKNFISKAGVVLVLLMLVLFLDNWIGFSYHYDTDRKINQAKEISTLLESETLTEVERNELKLMRSNTLKRQDMALYLTSLVKEIGARSIKEANRQAPTVEKPKTVAIIDPLFHTLTSAGAYILFTIFFIPYYLYTERNSPFLKTIGVLAVCIFIMTFFTLLLYVTLGLIPKIQESTWGWNYLINSIVQISTFVIFAALANSSNSQKAAIA